MQPLLACLLLTVSCLLNWCYTPHGQNYSLLCISLAQLTWKYSEVASNCTSSMLARYLIKCAKHLYMYLQTVVSFKVLCQWWSTVPLLQCSECSNAAEFTSIANNHENFHLRVSLTVVFSNECSPTWEFTVVRTTMLSWVENCWLRCEEEWLSNRHWRKQCCVLEIQQRTCHGCSPYQGAICYCSKWHAHRGTLLSDQIVITQVYLICFVSSSSFFPLHFVCVPRTCT